MKKFLMTAALAAVALGASAQTWPDKAVTMVVPFPPGGSTDQVARAVAPLLTEKFKQSFLVDNKAGATGTIGATFVKRPPADGYTFLVTSRTNSCARSMAVAAADSDALPASRKYLGL